MFKRKGIACTACLAVACLAGLALVAGQAPALGSAVPFSVASSLRGGGPPPPTCSGVTGDDCQTRHGCPAQTNMFSGCSPGTDNPSDFTISCGTGWGTCTPLHKALDCTTTGGDEP